MTNTYLIAKHLKITDIGHKIEACCLCGSKDYTGFERKKIISNSFMDWDFVNDSTDICYYCATCIGHNQKSNEAIRTTSFIATDSQLIRLKRENIFEYLISPPAEMFVFCVTYSHKKHLSFKAEINLPTSLLYSIRTDNSYIYIKITDLKKIMPIIQNWYTVCKESKQEPTWFTKNDILFGCSNFKRIEEYGVEKYLHENEIINHFRHTNFLELITYALNKQSFKKE